MGDGELHGSDAVAARRDALVGRLFEATLGAMDLYGVYLGDRLGLYRALADAGPLTSSGLADAAGVHERYAREWLEQQAATGILEVDDAKADAMERRFSLPAGHDEALLDELSLDFVGPFGRLVVGAGKPMEELLDAYRTGAGVPFEDYGVDLVEGQEAFTRPMFTHLLGEQVAARGARCPRAVARRAARPCRRRRVRLRLVEHRDRARVSARARGRRRLRHALDREGAREPRRAAGVEDRVTFHERDAADPELAGQYDLVFDLRGAARHVVSRRRAAARCAGCSPRAARSSSATSAPRTASRRPPASVERLLYGFSVLHCLPVGMVGENPAGTGTVMRTDTVRRYAEQAGFTGFEVLPIENDFYRFYGLTP